MQFKEFEKLLFFYYDNQEYESVKRTFKKYEDLSENSNPYILNILAEVLTDFNSQRIIENIKRLKKYEPTEEFININYLIHALAIRCYEEKRITYNDLLNNFEESELNYIYEYNPIFYYGNFNVYIHNRREDKEIELINRLAKNTRNPDFFLKNIDLVKDEKYKARLKIDFAIKNLNYEYGDSACKDLFKIFNKEKHLYRIENYKEDLSPYTIIIDFIKFFQVYGFKFLNTVYYLRLLEIFKDTPFEINVEMIRIIEDTKSNCLKKLEELKVRLSKIYDYKEINEIIKSYMNLLTPKNEIRNIV